MATTCDRACGQRGAQTAVRSMADLLWELAHLCCSYRLFLFSRIAGLCKDVFCNAKVSN